MPERENDDLLAHHVTINRDAVRPYTPPQSYVRDAPSSLRLRGGPFEISLAPHVSAAIQKWRGTDGGGGIQL